MGVLATLLDRSDWHDRLLNGSDYPLPGVVPLVGQALLDRSTTAVLRELREHNALLFDFVLTRNLAANGKRFAPSVFVTRRYFVPLA